MALDLSAKGRRLEPVHLTIERDRLRFFASVIGLDDPIYSDVTAARSAGHRDLLVPPTILFGLEMPLSEPFKWMEDIGVDMRFLLHAEQEFTYLQPIYGGDDIVLRSHIDDVFTKKGGALEFIVRVTEMTRGDEPVAFAKQTVVVRHPEKSPS